MVQLLYYSLIKLKIMHISRVLPIDSYLVTGAKVTDGNINNSLLVPQEDAASALLQCRYGVVHMLGSLGSQFFRCFSATSRWTFS